MCCGSSISDLRQMSRGEGEAERDWELEGRGRMSFNYGMRWALGEMDLWWRSGAEMSRWTAASVCSLK
jgi:hypothetical protein